MENKRKYFFKNPEIGNILNIHVEFQAKMDSLVEAMCRIRENADDMHDSVTLAAIEAEREKRQRECAQDGHKMDVFVVLTGQNAHAKCNYCGDHYTRDPSAEEIKEDKARREARHYELYGKHAFRL